MDQHDIRGSSPEGPGHILIEIPEGVVNNILIPFFRHNTKMFAVHQDAYRYAERRARQIVNQQRNSAETVSLTESLSVVTSDTVPKREGAQCRRHQKDRGSEPPKPRVIQVYGSSSNRASSSGCDDDDSLQQYPSDDHSSSPDDHTRQVQENLTSAMARLNDLEKDLQLHKDGRLARQSKRTSESLVLWQTQQLRLELERAVNHIDQLCAAQQLLPSVYEEDLNRGDEVGEAYPPHHSKSPDDVCGAKMLWI